MSDITIHNKRDLFDYLQQNIHGAYKQLLDERKLAYENNLLKTFLIENDIDKSHDPTFYIKNNFSFSDGGRKHNPKVKVLDDELIRVKYENALDIYIDISDPRIWTIYTMSNSNKMDKLIQKVSQSTLFDNIWLHHSFLKDFQSIGVSKGFGLDYDFEKFYHDDSAPALKMQMSGAVNFDKIYSALYDVEDLKGQITLSKIKLKSYKDKDEKSDFIIQDIKYNGKITARGNDIYSHVLNIHKLKTEYHNLLQTIESTYRLNWEANKSSLLLKGSPIFIVKEGAYMDVDLICDKIFDGSMPFKLLGIPKDYDGGKKVQVFDLHIGNSFNLQIYPDMFVFYIGEDVCGNTILRFLTNLQHSYSNSFKVVNDYGEIIFEA